MSEHFFNEENSGNILNAYTSSTYSHPQPLIRKLFVCLLRGIANGIAGH